MYSTSALRRLRCRVDADVEGRDGAELARLAARARERPDEAAVLRRGTRVSSLHSRARRLGVVAQPRPCRRAGRATRTSSPRGPRSTCRAWSSTSWAPWTASTCGQVAVAAQRIDALRRVEGHLAGVVDELAARGERDVLEGLGCEAVAGLGGERDAGQVVAVELLRRGAHVVERLRALRGPPPRTGPCGRAAAAPAVARHARGHAVGLDERRAPSGENVSASELVDHLLRGLGVEQLPWAA